MSDFLQNGNQGSFEPPRVFRAIQYLTIMDGYISTNIYSTLLKLFKHIQ